MTYSRGSGSVSPGRSPPRARCVSRGAEEDAGGENAARSEGPEGSSARERGAGEGEVAGVRRAAPSRSDSKRSRGGGAAAREGLGRLFLEVGTVPPGIISAP